MNGSNEEGNAHLNIIDVDKVNYDRNFYSREKNNYMINEENCDNNLLKTAHFNTIYEYQQLTHKKNVNNSLSEKEREKEISYLKEMEENTRLFDMKMKRLNNKNPTRKGEINYIENNESNENSHFKKEIEQLKNELNYKNLLIEELNFKIEEVTNNNVASNKEQNFVNSKKEENNIELNMLLDQYIKELEYLKRENTKNQIENKRFNDENENLKQIIEGFKKENNFLKSSLIKKEGENSLLMSKLTEKEKENLNLEKKLINEETQMKILKTEYDNITKNLIKVKKQLDSLTNKFEEMKANNYNLKQENGEMKKKLISAEKNSTKINMSGNYFGSNFGNNSGSNSNINNINKSLGTGEFMNRGEQSYSNYNSNSMYQYAEPEDYFSIGDKGKYNLNTRDSEEVYYPSEMKLKENKNEIGFVEQKLSNLLKQKLMTENELLKLPDKPRTINEINKKRSLEESLNSIENDINEIKLKIRKLNGK